MSFLTENEIQRMRELRSCGASVPDIADLFQVSERTTWRYVTDVVAERNGHKLELLNESIMQQLPQLPWEGLPVPRWLGRYLRKEAARARGDPDV